MLTNDRDQKHNIKKKGGLKTKKKIVEGLKSKQLIFTQTKNIFKPFFYKKKCKSSLTDCLKQFDNR